MSSVGCPRCSETFRIPDASLPEGVQVRCPWCTEIFQIGEIAPHLPPMAELLNADHQPISLSAISQAFELATTSAGTEASSPFGHGSSSHRLSDSYSASATAQNFGDTSQQPVDFQNSNEQTDARLKWSERLGWTPDPSSARRPAEVDDLEPEVVDGDLLTFDSDEDHLNQGRDVAEPMLTLDENATIQRGPRSPEPYEGFEEYDNEPFEPESDADDGSEYELADHGGVAVTGPVAPRPLSSLSGESKVSPSLNAKPRTKKKSSPVKQIIGVVLGGLASLPLAYAFCGRWESSKSRGSAVHW